jgi:NitT/TauT family transport system permease protein
MTRQSRYRIAVILGALAMIEVLCRIGTIDRLTMPPPTRIAVDLWLMLRSGAMAGAMLKTLTNVAIAFVAAVLSGIALGVFLHGLRAVRETLDPLFATYYAIPVFAFYPLLIILFGLGDTPQIVIGYMLAVVAVIVNTLNGLDRVTPVLLKTARIYRMRPMATALRVTLPSATPHLLTGVKLALAYAFIGIVGAEFLMSRTGMGYEISFAYNNFDNAVMYPLILLIIALATAVNMTLTHLEKALLRRRGLQ